MNPFGLNNVSFSISSIHLNRAIYSVKLAAAMLGKIGLFALQNFMHKNDGRNGSVTQAETARLIHWSL